MPHQDYWVSGKNKEKKKKKSKKKTREKWPAAKDPCNHRPYSLMFGLMNARRTRPTAAGPRVSHMPGKVGSVLSNVQQGWPFNQEKKVKKVQAARACNSQLRAYL